MTDVEGKIMLWRKEASFDDYGSAELSCRREHTGRHGQRKQERQTRNQQSVSRVDRPSDRHTDTQTPGGSGVAEGRTLTMTPLTDPPPGIRHQADAACRREASTEGEALLSPPPVRPPPCTQ